jgi:hypothetical protein
MKPNHSSDEVKNGIIDKLNRIIIGLFDMRSLLELEFENPFSLQFICNLPISRDDS